MSTMGPPHTRQYSMEELRAAVRVAEDWGTYVATHSIPDDSVRRALEAVVRYAHEFKRVIKNVRPRMAFSTDVVGGPETAARRHPDHEKWLHATSSPAADVAAFST